MFDVLLFVYTKSPCVARFSSPTPPPIPKKRNRKKINKNVSFSNYFICQKLNLN